MSRCPGSGPASGSPGPRRSPRRLAGLLRSARTLAAALPGSVGSGVVMPGWSGPSHWLHFSMTAWRRMALELRAVLVELEAEAHDVRDAVEHVDRQRLPERVVPDRLEAGERARCPGSPSGPAPAARRPSRARRSRGRACGRPSSRGTGAAASRTPVRRRRGRAARRAPPRSRGTRACPPCPPRRARRAPAATRARTGRGA